MRRSWALRVFSSTLWMRSCFTSEVSSRTSWREGLSRERGVRVRVAVVVEADWGV